MLPLSNVIIVSVVKDKEGHKFIKVNKNNITKKELVLTMIEFADLLKSLPKKVMIKLC